MIEIKMQTTTGEQTYPAYRVLQHLNALEHIGSLTRMEWQKEGKKNFLMGKISALEASVATPLSEAEADQAIAEYNEAMGLND